MGTDPPGRAPNQGGRNTKGLCQLQLGASEHSPSTDPQFSPSHLQRHSSWRGVVRTGRCKWQDVMMGCTWVRGRDFLKEGGPHQSFRALMWAAGHTSVTVGMSDAVGLWVTQLLLVSPCCCSVHHFNLGRRIPGFDYGPDGFGTGLTPLHLSDDGEGGTFHFHDPPPPYTAYKYPDIDQPDDPPPPYEASINPDSVFYDPAGASLPGTGSSTSLAILFAARGSLVLLPSTQDPEPPLLSWPSASF